MPLENGTTMAEAREIISGFLRETGCYDICARCPVYPGGEGCCHGCGKLARNEAGQVLGCGQPNLSCLTYTCSALNMHLLSIPDDEHGNKLMALTETIYGIPREGYRGCNTLPDNELLNISDPLAELKATIEIEKKDISCHLDTETQETYSEPKP